MPPTRPRHSLLHGATLFGWCLIAAVSGVCTFVLPPHLLGGEPREAAYGWPVIPWFAVAWANMRPGASLACSFILGIVLGAVQPRHWLLLAVSAASLPPVILLIN